MTTVRSPMSLWLLRHDVPVLVTIAGPIGDMELHFRIRSYKELGLSPGQPFGFTLLARQDAANAEDLPRGMPVTFSMLEAGATYRLERSS